MVRERRVTWGIYQDHSIRDFVESVGERERACKMVATAMNYGATLVRVVDFEHFKFLLRVRRLV